MSTYVLSYPRPGFRPPSSPAEGALTAQRAYQQWLELCDHITRAGGRILVLDADAPLESTGSASEQAAVYSANIGAPFLSPGSASGPMFLRARDEPGPGEPDFERDPVCAALKRAGLSVQVAQHRWHGQAEMVALPRNRFLLTYGPHSAPESCDEIKRLLPMGAHVLCIEMATGTGMMGLAHFTSKSNSSLLLVDRSALRSHTPEDIVKFITQTGTKGGTDVHILGREDVAAHATQSLCVRGTVHIPAGVSTLLRGYMARLGFQSLVVDVSALFGPEGGGPRALCNEWPGFVLSDDSPSYATHRAELFARMDKYGSV
jgi:hypothetical protein